MFLAKPNTSLGKQTDKQLNSIDPIVPKAEIVFLLQSLNALPYKKRPHQYR